MALHKETFDAAAKAKVTDRVHRQIINFNIGVYDKAVVKGKMQFSNLSLARRRASIIKHRVLDDLENQLKDFETHFIHNGGKVIWATDADQARKAVGEILEANYARKVVKSKSMVTEEIVLNEYLEKKGIEVLETDLGEFIVQISNEKPYHIVTPAMHKSAADVARLFHQKYQLPENSSPAEITAFVRNLLREKFLQAEVGITGANFLVTDSGAVAITENEGNALLTMSIPKIHIVIAGIEKLIPSIHDLELFWPLLASHGTGQNITAYNSLVFGPRQREEGLGPEQMYVILLDNGRSNVLAQNPVRRALACIRCGACLNACPIYRNIGGHSYGTVYQGPIGSVLTPHLQNFEDYQHLSFASTLCGKCTDVCPVGIDLHNLLLHNIHLSQQKGLKTKSENWAMKGYAIAMGKRKNLDFFKAPFKNMVLQKSIGKTWGKHRVLPEVAPKSFNQLWIEKNKA
ncbi:MAG TPA: [Fe-S]-binding protein [Bacteroidales bacterium]|nr:[Fe-S]-binding protein [Bacteroidales bacterium]